MIILPGSSCSVNGTCIVYSSAVMSCFPAYSSFCKFLMKLQYNVSALDDVHPLKSYIKNVTSWDMSCFHLRSEWETILIALFQGVVEQWDASGPIKLRSSFIPEDICGDVIAFLA
jgi:hypothetical protein